VGIDFNVVLTGSNGQADRKGKQRDDGKGAYFFLLNISFLLSLL
jgi:hypothetical protein